ncbi:MAG: 2Fe-2S iron-sulfur cluster binding domain-containing protein [Proteobacteria bacterium]|nr:2Fe-2S iron-sulfur cluster binding domain-containing protein [Pseudomonadota bacterium]
MSTVTVTDAKGQRHELEAAEGWRLMEIIRDYGVEIGSECGGAASCGECRVEVAARWRDDLHPRTADEEDKLDELTNVTDCTRLACQIIWSDDYDGLEVTIPPANDFSI